MKHKLIPITKHEMLPEDEYLSVSKFGSLYTVHLVNDKIVSRIDEDSTWSVYYTCHFTQLSEDGCPSSEDELCLYKVVAL